MEDIEILKNVRIFADLDDEEITKIGKLPRAREFKKEEMIVNRGDEGDSIFIIKDGAVRVCIPDDDGNEELIAILGDGDHFGEIALLDNHSRSADIISNDDSRLLEIRREDFEELLSKESDMAAKVYRAFALSLCSRLRETNENLLLARQFQS